MFKIMIVEDDEVISREVKVHLSSWGYDVYSVSDFMSVLSDFISFAPHIVLMDISLPFYNGFHWCGEIRKISKVPVIFITSASDNMNILTAVNMGGDDLISKPFDINVITAKIQALLRRTYDFTVNSDIMEHKGVILNNIEMSLLYNGKKIELTKNEHKILNVLISSSGAVVKREEIMRQLWETDCFVDDNTLTVNITRLRKKLEGINLEDFIKTKKGVGYYIK